MSYAKKELDRLSYDVIGWDKKVSFKDQFPAIAQYPEFSEFGPYDERKLFTYIVLLYDINSPLLKQAEVLSRKFTALEMAGFSKSGDNRKRVIEDFGALLNCTEDLVNRMIIRYIRLQRSHDYAAMIVMQEQYYQCLAVILSDVPLKDNQTFVDLQKGKNDLANKLPGTLQNIKELANKIFCGDDKLMYTAESIAEEESGIMLKGGYAELYAKPAPGSN